MLTRDPRSDSIAITAEWLAAQQRPLTVWLRRNFPRLAWADCEDLAGDAVLRAWVARARFDGNAAMRQGWLLTIARRAAVDLWRHRQIVQEWPLAAFGKLGERDAAKSEDAGDNALERAVVGAGRGDLVADWRPDGTAQSSVEAAVLRRDAAASLAPQLAALPATQARALAVWLARSGDVTGHVHDVAAPADVAFGWTHLAFKSLVWRGLAALRAQGGGDVPSV